MKRTTWEGVSVFSSSDDEDVFKNLSKNLYKRHHLATVDDLETGIKTDVEI